MAPPPPHPPPPHPAAGAASLGPHQRKARRQGGAILGCPMATAAAQPAATTAGTTHTLADALPSPAPTRPPAQSAPVPPTPATRREPPPRLPGAKRRPPAAAAAALPVRQRPRSVRPSPRHQPAASAYPLGRPWWRAAAATAVGVSPPRAPAPAGRCGWSGHKARQELPTRPLHPPPRSHHLAGVQPLQAAATAGALCPGKGQAGSKEGGGHCGRGR